MKTLKWNNKEFIKNNFLARIIGIIGEEITRFWLNNEKCFYQNYGRPTISYEGNKRVTLDFLIKKRKSENNDYFLVEQKNFFAYYQGKLRTIEDTEAFYKNYEKWSNLKSESTPAWDFFLKYKKFNCKIRTNEIFEIDKVAGTILIWSDVNESAKSEFLKKYGFSDVIGVTSMVKDLVDWKDPEFKEFIVLRESWISELFKDLQ